MLLVESSGDGLAKLEKIQLLVANESFDQPVERTAFRAQRDLVSNTPKRWTGITRRSWGITKPGPGQRLIRNSSKVMIFLEEGTGNAGTPTSHGGYIYPKTKRYLFIPLNARAALQGWLPGMKFGVDYVLAKRARGIKAMKIVAKYRPIAQQNLKNEVRAFLQKALS